MCVYMNKIEGGGEKRIEEREKTEKTETEGKGRMLEI